MATSVARGVGAREERLRKLNDLDTPISEERVKLSLLSLEAERERARDEETRGMGKREEKP